MTQQFYMRADRTRFPLAGLEHVVTVDLDANELCGVRACYRQLRAKWPAQEARVATLAILRCGKASTYGFVPWPRHPEKWGTT